MIMIVKPSGASNGNESSKSKEYMHSKPVGSCQCQTCNNPEPAHETVHITRLLHVWKATFLSQTTFPGQGSNETRFSGCIILYMIMIRDLDKNAMCSLSGENAISMSLSLHSISVCTMTSLVVVSKNLTLEDLYGLIITISPDDDILITRCPSESSQVSVRSTWFIAKFSRSRFHILILLSLLWEG